MTAYFIEAGYSATPLSRVDFPEGKTWDDVESWYVKWDTLFVKFKDEAEWQVFSLCSDTTDCIDWKRPDYVNVMSADEDEQPDYSLIIAET